MGLRCGSCITPSWPNGRKCRSSLPRRHRGLLSLPPAERRAGSVAELPQVLPEGDYPVNLDIAAPLVRFMTHEIIDQRIRAHLLIPLFTSPCLGGFEESPAVAAESYVGVDVPCFDISDGARGAAVND